MNKATLISVVIALVLIGGAIMFGRGGGSAPSVSNVETTSDGKQIVNIDAKGGYFPRTTSAKAGVPTTIKINTKNTFDCSLALAIPSIGYRENLPTLGETNIEIPPQDAGSVMRGTCSMGMYNFSIEFN